MKPESKMPSRWSEFHHKVEELKYGAETQDREALDELEKLHLELLKAVQDNFGEAVKKHGLMLVVDPCGVFDLEADAIKPETIDLGDCGADDIALKARGELEQLKEIQKAVDWVLDDASYKAPEEWNVHMERWYGRLLRAVEGET